MKMFDIITFGGAVIDAFLYTGIPEIHKKMCYPAGAKIELKNLMFSTGGAGTNTAVSFSRLGLKTGAIIKVGDDNNSRTILDELEKEKISFLGRRNNGLTDFSAILDSKEHERTILTYKHQSNSFAFSELSIPKLKTKWLYFSAMDDVALETQKKLANWAKKKGIKVAYNPSSYLTKHGIGYIREIVSNSEIIILNSDEARDLVPHGDLFKGLTRYGPKIVCITYGKEGNKVYDGKTLITSLPRKIKIAERTGAGDAFASGFVAGMMKFNDIKKSIVMGSLNAESVIQIPGAKNGLLSWKEMQRQVQQDLIRVKED